MRKVTVVVAEQYLHKKAMGTKDGKHINSEDSKLFLEQVGDVSPLQSRPRHRADKPVKPVARSRR